MRKSAKRAAAVAVLAGAAALAAPVGAAYATTSPVVARSAAAASAPALHSRTAPAIAGPQQVVPQFSNCTWNPANNSSIPASFNASGVNIRTGPDTSCTAIGAGYPGQSVTVRCAWYNSGDGRWWDYLNDNSTGKRGWSAEEYVNWSGSALVC